MNHFRVNSKSRIVNSKSKIGPPLKGLEKPYRPTLQERTRHHKLQQVKDNERDDWRDVEHSYRRDHAAQWREQRLGRTKQKTHPAIGIAGHQIRKEDAQEDHQSVEPEKPKEDITDYGGRRSRPWTRQRIENTGRRVKDVLSQHERKITKDHYQNYCDERRDAGLDPESD